MIEVPPTVDIQQQLERLAAKHPSLVKRGRNALQPRHIAEEFSGSDDADCDDADAGGCAGSLVVDVHVLDATTLVERRRTALFYEFAQAVCCANVIPRKELFEAWGMALYVHDHFFADASSTYSTRHIFRVADLACSHGLLSWALLLLRDLQDELEGQEDGCSDVDDDGDGDRNGGLPEVRTRRRLCSAVCIDRTMPPSSEKVALAMEGSWPNVAKRWDYVEGNVMQIQPDPSTLLVGIHCCGVLSDKVIDLAIRGNAPLALVPCCHTRKCLTKEQKENLREVTQKEKEEKVRQLGHSDDPEDSATLEVAPVGSQGCNTTLSDFIDTMRIQRLEEAGYRVEQARIPVEFSPKNHIILATPPTTPVPDDIRYQIRNHPQFGPAITLFNIRFDIPVADTTEARDVIRLVSGRAAANRRRRRPAPCLSLSLFVPKLDYWSLEQVHEMVRKVVEEEGPAVMEAKDNDKTAKANGLGILPILYRPQGIFNTRCNKDTIITRVGHVKGDLPRDDGRFAQTFSVDYAIDDETGTVPQVTKAQAKALHISLCHRISAEFGDKVEVRQIPR